MFLLFCNLILFGLISVIKYSSFITLVTLFLEMTLTHVTQYRFPCLLIFSLLILRQCSSEKPRQIVEKNVSNGDDKPMPSVNNLLSSVGRSRRDVNVYVNGEDHFIVNNCEVTVRDASYFLEVF